MPIYEIDGPDGKTYEIEGPPGATREQIIERVSAGLQSAPSEKAPNAIVDSIRSLPGGLAKGGAATAGAPRDVSDLLDQVVRWGGNKLSPGAGDKAVEFGRQNSLRRFAEPPSSSQLNEAISEPFGGYYEPQTRAGTFTETVASFAPAAVGGGGGALSRAARVVGPGVASEAAGQATEGTSYEPYARAAGALAGGVGVGAAQGALARAPVASRAEIRAAKQAAYRAADQAGVVIAPPSFQQFATQLGANLTRNNVVQADIHPNTLAALRVVQEEAAAGAPISLARADAIRQAVRTAIQKAGGPTGSAGDERLAGQVLRGLDDYLDNLTPADTTAGNAAVAVPILREARGLARREFKSEQIQELIDLAENQASSNYSASGREQALRVQFKNFNAKLIKDEALARSFTQEERAAIARVARGGPVGNVLRYFGKLAPTGVISGGAGVGLGAYAGGLVGGPVGGAIGSAAVPAIGLAARQGATMATGRNARIAEELMRAGPQAAPIQNPTNSAALIANILLSQATP
jgi:hypothetical protein